MRSEILPKSLDSRNRSFKEQNLSNGLKFALKSQEAMMLSGYVQKEVEGSGVKAATIALYHWKID